MRPLRLPRLVWREPWEGDPLSPSFLHLWLCDLVLSEAEMVRMASCLSDDEKDRANRYRFERDRSRFTAARGSLRMILGRYMGVAPEDLGFVTGERGKPAVAESPELRFNLSHSHDLALCAVCAGCEIGVDIERIDGNVATEKIAARFFARDEAQAIASLPVKERDEAFFFHWTCKEAFLKATGDGLLTLGLDVFGVSLHGPGGQGEIRVEDGVYASDRWPVRAFRVQDGYVGAVVCRSGTPPIRSWRFTRAEWHGSR